MELDHGTLKKTAVADELTALAKSGGYGIAKEEAEVYGGGRQK